MRLVDVFEQRKIGATYSSIRSRKQLPYPSGAQFTESALESALVDQLAFSPFVHDLVTQTTIRFQHQGKARRYTADVFVEYRAPDHEAPERFMIETKRQVDIDENAAEHAARFAAARAWCDDRGAAFCVLSETDIKTPYFANVRALAESQAIPWDAKARDVVENLRFLKTMSVAKVIATLEEAGLTTPDARVATEKAVIDRLLACDLTKPFNDQTSIRAISDAVRPESADPLLKTLRKVARESRA